MAKHVWIVANLGLPVPICWFIRSLTGLSYRRIGLILAFSFPLQRNLLYGQLYVFLLALIVAGCWCYVKEHYILSGALIAIAAMRRNCVFTESLASRRKHRSERPVVS